MEFTDLTYQGPSVDDYITLGKLPANLRGLLEQVNGFIQFGGGLHIRGACISPDWHSLAEVWSGSLALWKCYPALVNSDIPFGQDAVGDQFILRNDIVHHLAGETGGLNSLSCDLLTFLQFAQTNPVKFLSLYPLIQFQNEGGQLQPGQLLNVYPPFCTAQAAAGVSLGAISAVERLQFLADFSAKISILAEDTNFKITIAGQSTSA